MDRPKRAASQKKRTMRYELDSCFTSTPSFPFASLAHAIEAGTAHWVGYVDDNETPEMIMKKFEELDRLQADKTAPGSVPPPSEINSSEKRESDGESAMDIDTPEPLDKERLEQELGQADEPPALDEDQLEELFRRTSSIPAVDGNLEFSLVLGEDVDALIDEDNDYLAGSDVDDDEDSMIDISEGEEEEDYIDEFRESFFMASQRHTRRRSSSGSLKVRTGESEYFLGDSESSSSKPVRHDEESSTTSVKEQILTNRARARRDANFDNTVVMAPLDFTYLRNHAKMAKRGTQHSWAVTIRPKARASRNDNNSKHIMTSIRSFDFKSLRKRIYALYLDVPWQIPSEPEDSRFYSIKDFSKLNLLDLAENFIFIWIDKELQVEVVSYFERSGFVYVENLVWVKLTSDNEFVASEHYPYNRTKYTLFLFKRKGVKPKIQHQRSADVLFENVRKGKYLTEDKPDAVYEVIETMLHEATYTDEDHPGSLLEVWARKGKTRLGWTMVSEVIPEGEAGHESLASADFEMEDAESMAGSEDKSSSSGQGEKARKVTGTLSQCSESEKEKPRKEKASTLIDLTDEANDPMLLSEKTPSPVQEPPRRTSSHSSRSEGSSAGLSSHLRYGSGNFPFSENQPPFGFNLFDPNFSSPNPSTSATVNFPTQTNPFLESASAPSSDPPLLTALSSSYTLPPYPFSVENEKEEVNAAERKVAEANKDFLMAEQLQEEFNRERTPSAAAPSRGKKRGLSDFDNDLELLDESDDQFVDGEKGYDAMEYEPGK